MLHGADISRYQQGFDFRANAAACRFILIKQTEGLNWPDADPATAQIIRDMRNEAQQVGYDYVGLYHFARPQIGRTGRQEAEHFISFVGDLHPNEGVFLDYEANKGLSGEQLEDFALDFVTAIEEKWPSLKGCVGFYCYPNFLANMSTDRLVSRSPLWIAAYGANDGQEHAGAVELDRWKTYIFWQFTSAGRLPGWASDLDVNRFEGNEVELVKLSVGNNDVATPPVPAPPLLSNPVFVPEAWHGEVLRRGSSGVRVVQIQQRFKRRGWRITADGEFGRATDTIVKKFQTEKGLTSDGLVGRGTWDALYAYFDGVDVIPPPIDTPPPLPPAPPTPPPGVDLMHSNPVGQCADWGFDGNAGLDPVREFQRAFAWWALVVDGDAGPNTARAVQKVVEEGGKLSPHFTIGELACSHCGRIRYLRQTLECLEMVREAFGPFTPVSGYRCPPHNADVGGASSSQHKLGAACDLRIPDSIAKNMKFAGRGLCNGECYHGDKRDEGGNNTTGGTPSNPTIWYYC